MKDKIEFTLTVKRFGNRKIPYPEYNRSENIEPELLEELCFTSLNAKDTIRKLIGYIEE